MSKRSFASVKDAFNSGRVHVLVIALLGIIVYSNTFDAPFVFDDSMFITENPTVKDSGYFTSAADKERLSYVPDVVRGYLKTRWVVYLSFWANHRVDGLNVRGYHAVNLTIHIINSLLVYALVVSMFRTPMLRFSRLKDRAGHIGLFSALLFAAHPLQTEAVTYITQRFGELAAMFCLISIVAYVRSRLSEGKASRLLFYALSFFSAVLAMESKENAFTLPLAILLFEFMFFAGHAGRRVLSLVPLILTMVIIPVQHLGMQEGGLASSLEGATRLQTDMPRSDYLLTQSRVVVTYIRLFLLPVNQNLDYDYPIYGSLLDPQVLLSFLLLLGVFGYGVYALLRSRGAPELRVVAFGVFWFFLALSVESGVIPISELIFEYRLYLPSVGAISALVVSLYCLAERVEKGGGFAGKAMVPALVAVVLLFSVAAFARNGVWTDGSRLWGDVVKKSPNKERGFNNLGLWYSEKHMFDEAEANFQRALLLNPEYPLAHNNIARIYVEGGELDMASEHLEKAIELDPDYYNAYYTLGNLYIDMGRAKEAIEHLEAALRRNPYYANAQNNLGLALLRTGNAEEAIEHFRAALSIDPGLLEALNNLGTAYMASGRLEEAIEQLNEILAANPDFPDAYYSLGVAFMKQGRYDMAVKNLQSLLRLRPGDSEAWYNLARLSLANGNVDKAIVFYENALKFNPNHVAARSELMSLYESLGR
jgi:tetratricopeptide (TPR) repeat protein